VAPFELIWVPSAKGSNLTRSVPPWLQWAM
jgi:hypothetical protein